MSAPAESREEPQTSDDNVVALASERARIAQRAWREAQEKRLLAAQRAERLALELKATEEQAEARAVAALAAAAARREAQQRRLDAATRAERLELELQRGTRSGTYSGATLPFGPDARRRARRSALALYFAVAAVSIAIGVGARTYGPEVIAALDAPAPAFSADPGDSLQLRLSYRISAQ